MRRTQKLLDDEGTDRSSQQKHFDESAARKRADNRLSTHIEPVHLDDSLLQESLSEEKKKPEAAPNPVEGREKLSPLRRKKAENRLSTHVEAVTIDSSLLAENFGGYIEDGWFHGVRCGSTVRLFDTASRYPPMFSRNINNVKIEKQPDC